MYLVSGFRSTVPEHAGWHSHIPEPDEEPEDEEEQVEPPLLIDLTERHAGLRYGD